MKYLLLFFLVFGSLFAQNNICFYSNESYIKNFKTLKIDFYKYINGDENYEFQPFDNINMFEEFISKNNSVVILSSSHYNQIKNKYHLTPLLVAIKNSTMFDTKVLVGKKDKELKGIITTALRKDIATNSLNNIVQTKNFDILSVSKEIDALMSVGFGMSDFAYVSKDSFELLKKVNGYLADLLTIYKESDAYFRMVVATNSQNQEEIIKLFKDMKDNENGQNILNTFGIESFEILGKNDIDRLNLEGEQK